MLDNATIAAGIKKAQETFENIKSQAQPLLSPVPATSLQPLSSPDLPQPKAPSVASAYTAGVGGEVASLRANLEAEYKRQRDSLTTERDRLQKEQDAARAAQEKALGDAQHLTTPFRADLETKERERLKIEDNFFANQKLVSEMESIASGLEAEAKAITDVAAPETIQQGKLGKVKADATARLGMLQAVFAARNNQIGQAEQFIDRSVEAITADRKDQLAYYSSVLEFYGKRESDTGAKLLDVSKEDRAFAEKQVALLEGDLADTKARADRIKEMLTDPKTAEVLAGAGVKLNDSEEEINRKLADYAYQKNVIDLTNTMEEKGYQYLPVPALIAGKPENELVRLKDSKGKERVYWKPGATVGETAAVDLYLPIVQKAIAEGATPEEAVLAATAVADQSGGGKLDLKNQGALLAKAKQLSSAPASTATAAEVPVTFDSLMAKAQSGQLSSDEIAQAVAKKIVSSNQAARLDKVNAAGGGVSGAATGFFDALGSFLFG